MRALLFFFLCQQTFAVLQSSSCGKGYYRCIGENCISEAFKCDGEPDCVLGDDEFGCPGKPSVPRKRPCSPHTFACKLDDPKISSICIDIEEICDGVPDCPEGDDERNCSTKGCSPEHFKCNDDVCIPDYWVCDGSMDCFEGEDEHNCEREDPDHCSKNEFRCREGKGCLSEDKICDGKRDCPLGDDEEFCQMCDQLNCSHKCSLVDGEAICTCPKGSRLSVDERNCSEIDQCEAVDRHGCQHFCKLDNLTFFCACEADYSLRKDKLTCEVHRLYEARLIVSSERLRSGTEICIEYIVNFAFAYERQKIFLPQKVKKIFYSRKRTYLISALNQTHSDLAFYDNDTYTVLKHSIEGIHSIAVDSLTNNIYYTTDCFNKSSGIYVCAEVKSQKVHCVKLLSGTVQSTGMKSQFAEIVLDSRRGLMYFVEKYNGTNHLISARLDGQQAEVIEKNKLGGIRGLALDPIANCVYFGDYEFELIEKIDLNSMRRSLIHSKGVHRITNLIYFNGGLFWTENTSNSTRFIDLRLAGSNVTVLHHKTPTGLTIDHFAYENFKNPAICPDDRCRGREPNKDEICVPIPSSSNGLIDVCICPRYFEFSNETKSCLSISERVCNEKEYCLNGGICTLDVFNEEVDELPLASCRCPQHVSGNRCEKKLGSILLVACVLVGIVIFLLLGLILYSLVRARSENRNEVPAEEPSIYFVNRGFDQSHGLELLMADEEE